MTNDMYGINFITPLWGLFRVELLAKGTPFAFDCAPLELPPLG